MGEALLRSGRTEHAFISFTSACGLRCVYCGRLGNVQGELPARHLDGIIAALQARGAQLVTVSALGETTARRGWDGLCGRLLDAGFELNIMTNLSRGYSQREIATLARFKSLTVSVDTVDPGLFRRLRVGGDLHMVLLNIQRIRSPILARGETPPFLFWTAVVTDRNVFALEELVRYGLKMRVNRFFFTDLNSGTAPNWARPVASLDRARLTKAAAVFARVRGILDRAAIPYWIDPRLPGSTRPEVRPPPGRRTRDCLAPWREAMIVQDGSVRVCCFSLRSFGSLEEAPLGEILEGAPLRAYRSSLLAGRLRPECRICGSRAWIGVPAFREKVAGYVGGIGPGSAGGRPPSTARRRAAVVARRERGARSRSSTGQGMR